MRSTTYLALAALLTSTVFAFPLSDVRASDESFVTAAPVEPVEVADSESFATAAVADQSTTSSDQVAMDVSPVTDGVLSESRGAFSPADLLNLNNSYLNANSGGNVVNGGVTGNNAINGGSFTNTQGLVNVIQNSGNNVVIQSSTIVNMTMITN